MMATQNEGGSVRLEELLVSSLAQTDGLATLIIEKGLIGLSTFVIPNPLFGNLLQKLLLVYLDNSRHVN
jgi:hypothetical protein